MKPLSIDGTARAVEQAELSMRVETETWDEASQSWVYGRNSSLVVALEIRVDEKSGQDGALSPDLYFHLPVAAPASLDGFLLDDKQHQAEAYWGNDAPPLLNNQLEIRSQLKPGPVQVRWTAQTAQGQTLVFEGPAEFMGVSLKVKKVTDVNGFLKKVWPALDPARLELISETEVDYGEDFDQDRRHWMELHYDFVS